VEVDVDIVLYDGEAQYCVVVDNGPTIEPYFNETWGLCPSQLDDDKQAELRVRGPDRPLAPGAVRASDAAASERTRLVPCATMAGPDNAHALECAREQRAWRERERGRSARRHRSARVNLAPLGVSEASERAGGDRRATRVSTRVARCPRARASRARIALTRPSRPFGPLRPPASRRAAATRPAAGARHRVAQGV
jgi:hypothetical protein